jgi:hypothetical protein
MTWVIILAIAAAVVQTIKEINDYKTDKEKWKNNKWKPLRLSVLALTIILIFGLALKEISDSRDAEHKAEVESETGKLENTGAPVRTFPKIVAGSLHMDNVQNPFPGFNKIWVENGQIMVDIDFFDRTGESYGSLRGNIWHIQDPKVDYNDDSNGVEVVSADGKTVLFQIDYRGDEVYCQGAFCQADGRCDYVSSKGDLQNPPVIGSARFAMPEDFYIKPLFKYPRDIYLHVRDK